MHFVKPNFAYVPYSFVKLLTDGEGIVVVRKVKNYEIAVCMLRLLVTMIYVD